MKVNHLSKEFKRKKRPTCTHCRKIVHTSNKCWSNEKPRFNGKFYNYNKHAHRASECTKKIEFKGKCFNCNKKVHKSSEFTTKKWNLAEQIVKEISY